MTVLAPVSVVAERMDAAHALMRLAFSQEQAVALVNGGYRLLGVEAVGQQLRAFLEDNA